MDRQPPSSRGIPQHLPIEALREAPDAILWLDEACRLRFINRRAQALLGGTARVGRPLAEVSQALAHGLRAVCEALATGEPRASVLTVDLPQRRAPPLPLQVSFNTVVEGDRRFLCLYLHDISEQRHVEGLLRLIAESTAKTTGPTFFRTLVRTLAQTLKVRYAFVTERLGSHSSRVRMVAFWAGEDFGENLEYEVAGTPCQVVVDSGETYFISRDLQLFYPGTELIGDSYLGVPIFDTTGVEVIGHVCLMDETPMSSEVLVTTVFEIFASRAGAELRRQHAERALRRSEEKYRFLVENQTDLMVRLSPAGEILFANRAYCDQLGGHCAALAGRSFLDPVHEEDQAATFQAIAAMAEGHAGNTFEHRVKGPHGWIWLAWSNRGIRDGDGGLIEIVAVGRDVTEQRRAEEQTRQTLQELAHVSRLTSMGEMSSAMAHELNQPLTAILTFSQAGQRLLQQTPPLQPDLTQALGRIADNAQRAGAIIQRMRGFVRKEALHRTPVDPNFLVHEVLHLAGPELRQNQVRIQPELAEALEPIAVDSIQIQQVILNLVRNGMDAINEFAPPRRTIRIETQQSEEAVRFRVTDSGPGIAEAIVDKLFDPFVTTKEDGIGIGLAICRSIVEDHGGELSARNAPPDGACFEIRLPYQPRDAPGDAHELADTPGSRRFHRG